MASRINCDVVILGGGVSGLLLASELSTQYRVTLLEKESAIPQNRFWVTNKKCASLNPDLEPLIDRQISHMDIMAHDQSLCRVMGPFILWDRDRLLRYLASTAESNGARIVTGARFYTYYADAREAVVRAGPQEYGARLIVDCMGYSSPIIDDAGALRVSGYYLLYGKELELAKPLSPIGFYNIILGGKPKYLEVFPTSRLTAYAILIQPVHSLEPRQHLSRDFEFTVADSHLREYFHLRGQKHPPIGGIIPVGRLRYPALDRVLFYGEAGQLNPAATATGFTMMLYSYKKVAKQLSRCIASGRLDRGSLRELAISPMSEFNRRLQLHVFQEMLTWTSTDFRRLVRELNSLDNATVVDILFGELPAKRVFGPTKFLDLLSSGSYVLLRNAVKSLFLKA